MSSVVIDQTDCLNCGTPLHGTFCGSCGQRVSAPNPTLHDFLHELSHELLHVDGRLFQSIKLLFTRPGWLTREHCEGRRARYAAPMRLYLNAWFPRWLDGVTAPAGAATLVDRVTVPAP